MANTTQAFLGDLSTWRQAQVVLDDIHALWGGKRILVRGDGQTSITEVDLAQQEQVYRLDLGAERARSILNVCALNDVLGISFPERPRVPDESSTRLGLTNSQAETRWVVHWANDPVEFHFEEARAVLTAVYDNMQQLGATLQPPKPAAPPASTPPSPDRLLQAAVDFFTQDKWTFERSPDRPVLRLPFQGKNGKWTCFAQIRTVHGGEQLLFYSVLPINVPEAKRLAVAEFITRANYGMAIGNFELDFSDGEVRYKSSIDATGAELTPPFIKPLVYTNCLMMDKYLPGIIAVIYANTSPAEAVKQREG